MRELGDRPPEFDPARAINMQRIVTNGVFMSLIGATVVQTGLIIGSISSFLFKDNSTSGS